MRKYIFVGIGGILGSISRYLAEGIHFYHFRGNFPINTLFINISGSLIMALVVTISFEIWEFNPDIKFGITSGFLGAYTTFSTLCKESIDLMKNGFYISAILYISVSAILGIAAAYFGMLLARRVVSKLVKKYKSDFTEIETDKTKGGLK